MGLAMPGLALASQLYQSVAALGHSREGTHALMLALEAINGVSDVAPVFPPPASGGGGKA